MRENLKGVKAFNKKVQKVIPRAAASAANRAGQSARTAATRKTRETYAVKAGAVNKTFKLTRATPGNLNLSLTSKDKGLPLINFKVRPSKPVKKQPKSLKASVKLGSNKPVGGAFIAQLGDRVVVAQRDGEKRFPVSELYGPAVPVMVNNPEVREEVDRTFRQTFENRMPHEVQRVLGKLGLG
ncbi:phage tail protein [Paenibacillus pabuli]|uniref:phage tail protein n=1 Tax=Paenibacillus pabuli TaxID=1472 RepID=UPI001FFF5003|nr:phage tail protein [Paenibacillus pabuli]UPK45888.1 phage tail protein [Paenibacillus pabuli]